MVDDSRGLGADRVDVRRGPATTGDRPGQDAQTVLVIAAFSGQVA